MHAFYLLTNRYFGLPGSGVPYNSTYAFSAHPGPRNLNYGRHLSLPPTQSPSVNESWAPSTSLNEVGTSGQPDLSLSPGIGSRPHMSADAESSGRNSRDENGGLNLLLSVGLPNVTFTDIAELEARERAHIRVKLSQLMMIQ